MSYLDKAKGVAIKEPAKRRESTDYELNEITKKASQTVQPVLNPLRNNPPDTLPRLPWQLERLLSAAGSNVLTADLPGVPDVGAYALAWGCAYLTGDRAEAERRLWQVYRAWQGVN